MRLGLPPASVGQYSYVHCTDLWIYAVWGKGAISGAFCVPYMPIAQACTRRVCSDIFACMQYEARVPSVGHSYVQCSCIRVRGWGTISLAMFIYVQIYACADVCSVRQGCHQWGITTRNCRALSPAPGEPSVTARTTSPFSTWYYWKYQ